MNPVHVSLLFWRFWDFSSFFLSVLERCLGAQVNPRGSCVSVRGETSPRADGTEVPAHQNPLNKIFKVYWEIFRTGERPSNAAER